GEQEAVEFDLLLRAAFTRDDRCDLGSVARGDLRDEAAEDDRNAFLLEGFTEFPGGVLVGVRRNLVERVDDRNLRSEAGERLAELEANRAGADDQEGLW